ncbi:MAG: (Fe-S)-binding protein [Elusimicrobiaceae bacterium]|nr:(Fe-S)-binding protein [Elusimicrobiaceae bacterium]
MKNKIYLNPSSFVSTSGKPETLIASVNRCTRCNACVQSCPSYLIKPEETASPRGRVQLIRLILEGKVKPQHHLPLIKHSLQDCLLCGRCTLACAGNIAVAQQVSCLSKAVNLPLMPASLKFFLHLKVLSPRFFDILIRFIQFLRYWKLFIVTGIGKKSSLYWIKYLHQTMPAPKQSLQTQLRKNKINISPQKPDFIYLPSLQACYAEPDIGQKTLQLLAPKKTHILFHTSTGFFEYLHGEHTRCLSQAKHLLTQWEKLSSCKAPLVTDSWETFAFLKNYPILFASLSGWQKRAEVFASHVRFVADFIKPQKSALNFKTALDFSGLLFLPLENISFSRRILKTQAGKNLLECDYSRFPIPLGSVLFARPAQAEQVLLENVKDVARQQIKQVYCLSGWAALILAHALKRHYPAAQAQHIVYLQDQHDRI